MPLLEPLSIFIGDLHAGSKLAPLVPVTDPDGVTYGPSRLQAALHGFLAQALADVKAAAKGCAVNLHLGGDLVDGVGHHGSTQTLLTYAGQRDLAVELLRPWVNIASHAYGLLGTDAHVGDNGEEDRSVCQELGVPTAHQWAIITGGRRLDWAHHASLGTRWWGQEGPLVALANDTRVKLLSEGDPPPDLIVRHHVHRYARTHAKGTDVVTVPGWQAQTSYVRRMDPSGLLTVGLVLWWPKRNEIKLLPYKFPSPPATVIPNVEAKTKKRVVTR